MLKREELEELLLKEDLVEYLSSMSKDEVEELLGDKVSRMIGFEQKNIHHCYDLFGHTLHTVEAVSNKDISEDNLKRLKVAALFHDIGKPDVAKMNPKTGQQVFYGHAQKSQEIANELLKEFGYKEDEIKKIEFYIKHHDDFISYKSQVPEYMQNHEFVREINDITVAEKMIENKYDFAKMGLDEHQIRYVCYTLAHEEEPKFKSPNGIIDIKVDMDRVKENIASNKFNQGYVPTKEDYQLLLNLCKADATAQTELYRQNGKVLCSRKEKLENMNNIEHSLDIAYNRTENVSLNINFEQNILNSIINEANENKALTQKRDEAQELEAQYQQVLNKEEQLNDKSI